MFATQPPRYLDATQHFDIRATLWAGLLRPIASKSRVYHVTRTVTLAASHSVATEHLDMVTLASEYSFARGLLRKAAALW